MIRPSFPSSSDRLELEACVRRQREGHGIARRAIAILLLEDGKSCQEIADFLYLDDDTIRGWHKTHLRDGWDALAFDGWKGCQSRMMSSQEAALCTWLEGRFCRSTVEIRSHIVSEFGLECLGWNIRIPAASSFWPGWSSSIASPRLCCGLSRRKGKRNSSHFTAAC